MENYSVTPSRKRKEYDGSSEPETLRHQKNFKHNNDFEESSMPAGYLPGKYPTDPRRSFQQLQCDAANSENKGAHSVSEFKQNEASKELTDKDNKVKQDFGKLNGKSKITSSSSSAIKLWEGSLHLNASTKASAVAYYKSGEKLLDINWSKIVEVKGKVRLDAFEYYIQDLHRSRTSRGMMVISVHWKKGTSKSGLKGMEEVAKRYEEGERVGVAEVSPGVQIYMCPRSQPIITLLAKHGFLKGKSATKVNSESFIGCIVWKKKLGGVNSSHSKCTTTTTTLQEQLPNSSPSHTTPKHEASKASSQLPNGDIICREDIDEDLPEFDYKDTNQTSLASVVSSKKKNMFDDDDDDMPEWVPPQRLLPIRLPFSGVSLHERTFQPPPLIPCQHGCSTSFTSFTFTPQFRPPRWDTRP